MTPLSVEWFEPDEERRAEARRAKELDVQRIHSQATPEDRLAARNLDLAIAVDSLDEFWRRRHPNLEATVRCHGLLLDVAHQPEQWGLAFGPYRVARPTLLREARWTALVATSDGIVEMDPLALRVVRS